MRRLVLCLMLGVALVLSACGGPATQEGLNEAGLWTVFGKILEGLDVAQKIQEQPVELNPQTGEEITICARRILTFKPSQVLKSMINGNGTQG